MVFVLRWEAVCRECVSVCVCVYVERLHVCVCDVSEEAACVCV